MQDKITSRLEELENAWTSLGASPVLISASMFEFSLYIAFKSGVKLETLHESVSESYEFFTKIENQ